MLRVGALLVSLLAVGAPTPAAIAQDAGSIVVREILRTSKNDVGQNIRLSSKPIELVVSEYSIAAGARLPDHKHPFQRYAFVAQGELRVQQVGGSSKVYKAGDFVTESVARWHFGEAIGQSPVKLIVIDQIPRGAKSTIQRPAH